MEFMITVIKQNPEGKAQLRYQGTIIKHLPYGVILQASWTYPMRDLGYTRFEPGDRFIEYYYTNRWFNIFDIANADETRKGWYCNITEPAVIFDDRIEQVDLLLDVWVNPEGNYLILDEDEFAATTTLTERQRRGAKAGLQALLHMLKARQEVFSSLTP